MTQLQSGDHAPEKTRALYVLRTAQYQRSGNTRFCLLVRERTPTGFGLSEQQLTIRVEDCNQAVCETLSMLREGDILELRFTSHVDMGAEYHLYVYAAVVKALP